MKILVFEPGCGGKERDIPNTLEAMQEIVGGHIQPVKLFKDDDWTFIANEEGILKNLPRNRFGLFGTIFAVGVDKDEFCDIPENAKRNLLLLMGGGKNYYDRF